MAVDGFRRLRVAVTGTVQGVGYRPFVHRLAVGIGLSGWVRNTAGGVLIEIEGAGSVLDAFLRRLQDERPVRAEVRRIESSVLPYAGVEGFEILGSEETGVRTAWVPSDVAVCGDCLREVFDPSDRRYLYPFTNCTHCGPRFSIIESIPYDRPRTTMKDFPMCDACRREYENPLDRRFHAQPVACPDCGPQLEFWDVAGKVLVRKGESIKLAAEALRRGEIVALKGLGGFQLLADARNGGAVTELRRRKRREEKPFALMFPDEAAVEKECVVSADERSLLLSPESPIVLLARRPDTQWGLDNGRPPGGSRGPGSIADFKRPFHSLDTGLRRYDGIYERIQFDNGSVSELVAPGNPFLGAMLPYTPLHHLLMRELGFPVVATSGNLSDEPICIDEREALSRLSGIADVFLVHDRPIARPLDDSVARVVFGEVLVLRRARGYAPHPVETGTGNGKVLAVGGHRKNAVAVSVGGTVVLGSHVGDLDAIPAREAFRRSVDDLQRFYGVSLERVAADLHPDYFSNRFARESGLTVESVQHHHAHMVSCMAENGLDGDVLGVVWDGSGYGVDGSIWGGEFLRGNRREFSRAGCFRRFRLPGGEAAVREPRRSALGVLFEVFGPSVFDREDLFPLKVFSPDEGKVLRSMLERGVQSPLTSSAGRLFDAVASILDLRQKAGFEGQAAMELEFAARRAGTEESYAVHWTEGDPWVFNWVPMIREIASDVHGGTPSALVAAKFHNALADVVVGAAERGGEKRVVLSGGCFQNVLLLERAVSRLRSRGFEPFFHHRIPPNDGGLALGQAVVALSRMEGS